MGLPDKLRYNLPGFGLIRVHLFDSARQVFDFYDSYGHLRELREIKQLGTLTEVLPGAHHTRYEYLMAQLALITELCYLTGQLPAGLSMTRSRPSFGTIPGISAPPSNAEILMVLALLTNIGHVPTTFAGERALLKHLRDDSKARGAFRAGLPDGDREGFGRIIETFSVYRLNYYIALFVTERYRRKTGGPEIVDFSQSILRSFIQTRPDDPDQALVALWAVFRSIRRITYLALDSLYAPVPFSLDLSSFFFSLEHFLADVFAHDSAFHLALDRFEGVLRDTVYLAPRSQLEHARRSDAVLSALRDPGAAPRQSLISARCFPGHRGRCRAISARQGFQGARGPRGPIDS